MDRQWILGGVISGIRSEKRVDTIKVICEK